MYCPECGTDAAEANFCPECGNDLTALGGGATEAGVCPECGTDAGKAKFCPECGHQMPKTDGARPARRYRARSSQRPRAARRAASRQEPAAEEAVEDARRLHLGCLRGRGDRRRHHRRIDGWRRRWRRPATAAGSGVRGHVRLLLGARRAGQRPLRPGHRSLQQGRLPKAEWRTSRRPPRCTGPPGRSSRATPTWAPTTRSRSSTCGITTRASSRSRSSSRRTPTSSPPI